MKAIRPGVDLFSHHKRRETIEWKLRMVLRYDSSPRDLEGCFACIEALTAVEGTASDAEGRKHTRQTD